MSDSEKKKLEAERLRDSAWQDVEQYLDDIDRFLKDGPTEMRDIDIMMRILVLVRGEITYRQEDLKDLEEGLEE